MRRRSDACHCALRIRRHDASVKTLQSMMAVCGKGVARRKRDRASERERERERERETERERERERERQRVCVCVSARVRWSRVC